MKQKERERQNRGNGRPCVHRLSGRINAPKECIFNYECYHCLYDQWLDHFDSFQENDHGIDKNKNALFLLVA